MNSIKLTSRLPPRNVFLARSFLTTTASSRKSTLIHNGIFLNNKSFFLSSYINNKRYFSNFFSKTLKLRSSISQNFFDLSTSINKQTSNLPLTTLSNNQTSNLPLTTLSPTSAVITAQSLTNPPSPQTHTSLPIIGFNATISPIKRNKFMLNHGGSGIPKHSENFISTKNDGNYFSIGCGEDSFFLRHDSLGVADGVGGWRNVASLHNSVADSSLFSRNLMHHSYVEIEKYDRVDDKKYNEISPVDVLQASYEQSMKALEGVIGSTTALIAIIREDELRIANLGDCTIGVIRYNEFIFRNEEQQHSFNYPFQLGTGSLNTPNKDSQPFTIKIQKGDIIVMGSDGMYDNLFDSEILDEIISCQNRHGLNPQIISDNLAWRAKIASNDTSNATPFQYRATQEGLYYQGGKKDDISVLVAIVADNHLDKD